MYKVTQNTEENIGYRPTHSLIENGSIWSPLTASSKPVVSEITITEMSAWSWLLYVFYQRTTDL